MKQENYNEYCMYYIIPEFIKKAFFIKKFGIPMHCINSWRRVLSVGGRRRRGCESRGRRRQSDLCGGRRWLRNGSHEGWWRHGGH